MIPLIFIGIILNHLGLLKGWLLFWYIVSIVFKILVAINE
jgi:hypothetical protein